MRCSNPQQRTRRADRTSTAAFPVPQRLHADSTHSRELCLRELLHFFANSFNDQTPLRAAVVNVLPTNSNRFTTRSRSPNVNGAHVLPPSVVSQSPSKKPPTNPWFWSRNPMPCTAGPIGCPVATVSTSQVSPASRL